MTFRDIRAWLHQRSLLAIAPLVALAGIDDLATFRNMDRAALVRIGVPHDLINRLLGDDQLVLDYMPPVRRDIQPYHTTRHGSLNRAIAAGAPTSREQALQLLEDETYAPSSRDPRVARWKTWCQIANSWDMPPAPLTVKLVKAAGASFKAGGYRSFQNYYTQARQEHRRLTGEDPAADIEQAITDVSRSIRRAQGPTPFKDSFQLELLSADQFPWTRTTASTPSPTPATSPSSAAGGYFGDSKSPQHKYTICGPNRQRWASAHTSHSPSRRTI